MSRSKRKPESHIIGEEAVRIIEGLLPAYWTVREYHPDCGIDLDVELFEKSGNDKHGHPVYDTLGEHVFLQVKGCNVMEPSQLKVAGRINVELTDPKATTAGSPDENVVAVFPFQIETSELVTVQRMGAAVPVLRTLVEVPTKRIFFVCLNDYIDKIITPFNEQYAEQATKVIHIPTRNEIVDTDDGLLPIRFYGKRAKLMAAFSKFKYQHTNWRIRTTKDCFSGPNTSPEFFCDTIFWGSCDWWKLIAHVHEMLVAFSETGSPRLMAEHAQLPLRVDDEEPGWTDGWSGTGNILAVRSSTSKRSDSCGTSWRMLETFMKKYAESGFFLPL